jgi:hypothetical protein
MKSSLPATAGIPLQRSVLAAAAGALLALGSGAASAVETTFVGFTNGCFVAGCTPTATSAATSTTLNGLTFTNSTFNVTTAGGFASVGNGPGTPNVNNLGSFTLTGAPFSYAGNSFDLLVSFTAPPGTSPNPALFTSVVSGNVQSTDNGGIFVNFDNSMRHFTFGSGDTAGSFDFFINDVSATAGRTVALTGSIISQVSAVPEPETYALFLAGLGAIGFMARRRKS